MRGNVKQRKKLLCFGIQLLTIMNLKKIIQSNKGASIFFALFVFLVCAGVGSVVLASGSAAAGRVSKVSETDRRYYSVMSAVDLLKDTIDGQEFEVDRTKVTTVTTVYTIESLGEEDTEVQPERTLESENVTVEYTTSVSQMKGAKGQTAGDGLSIDRGDSLPGDAAIDLILGPYPIVKSYRESSDRTGSEATEEEDNPGKEAGTVTAEAQWNQTCPAFSEEEICSYTLSLSDGEVKDSLSAEVESVLSWDGANGKLTFTVTSSDGETGRYSAKIIFDALITEVPHTEQKNEHMANSEGDSEEDSAEGGAETPETISETNTEITNETKKTTLKWVYSHIETKPYEIPDEENETED